MRKKRGLLLTLAMIMGLLLSIGGVASAQGIVRPPQLATYLQNLPAQKFVWHDINGDNQFELITYTNGTWTVYAFVNNQVVNVGQMEGEFIFRTPNALRLNMIVTGTAEASTADLYYPVWEPGELYLTAFSFDGTTLEPVFTADPSMSSYELPERELEFTSLFGIRPIDHAPVGGGTVATAPVTGGGGATAPAGGGTAAAANNDGGSFPWWILIVVVVVGGVAALYISKAIKDKKKRNEVHTYDD